MIVKVYTYIPNASDDTTGKIWAPRKPMHKTDNMQENRGEDRSDHTESICKLLKGTNCNG